MLGSKTKVRPLFTLSADADAAATTRRSLGASLLFLVVAVAMLLLVGTWGINRGPVVDVVAWGVGGGAVVLGVLGCAGGLAARSRFLGRWPVVWMATGPRGAVVGPRLWVTAGRGIAIGVRREQHWSVERFAGPTDAPVEKWLVEGDGTPFVVVGIEGQMDDFIAAIESAEPGVGTESR
ncbi:hypothetical protein [uncultured Demequina sp.]|uniref:hypothetical protein n=1 Tax=uncultured Demequina sp. TaxID=693499 RepID=UPI0025E4FA9C|nr:hypothetical protein [uncultured Demequina sp.]